MCESLHTASFSAESKALLPHGDNVDDGAGAGDDDGSVTGRQWVADS